MSASQKNQKHALVSTGRGSKNIEKEKVETDPYMHAMSKAYKLASNGYLKSIF